MAFLDPTYAAAYLLGAAGVALVLVMIFYHSRKSGTTLKPGRLLALTRDEALRLKTLDPVFLMHLSIAVGVGLSILEFLLDPLLSSTSVLKLIFLLVSLPLILGLVAAFGWRIERFFGSKRVEGGPVKAGKKFSSASSSLQGVLMLAIALTTAELVLNWFPNSFLLSSSVGLARNLLVAIYYTKPTVNLLSSFDRPLSRVETPFKLSDVMAGTVDASQVKVGVGKLADFSRSEKLTFDSCVEIGACESACPATAAGRPLSPRVLVRQLSIAGKGGLVDPFESVTEDELWSCTSCGACVSSCPVGVGHLDLVYDLRRDLVGRGKLDTEKSHMLENLGTNQNPYGFKSDTRGDWANDQGIDTLESNPTAEYLYWVGCVSSFDQRAQRVAKSLSKVLKSAGVSFAILGSEEMCTGDPARRLGEEGRYQELAYQNIEKLNSRGVKKIVATCPHCFNALKNEYPSFGGKYEVIYHTQLISDLIAAGKIKIPAERVRNISVTLHDACYAARYNNIFDEPREALSAAVGDVREMQRHKEKTFCCGAGGSNYWFKVSEQRSISGIRTEEAARTGAKTIATECPFCLSMFEDSTKVLDTGMEVKDVAELVAECLP